MKFIESILEKILWNSRFVILVAVVSTLIASFAVFALGTSKMFQTVGHIITYITHPANTGGHVAKAPVAHEPAPVAESHGAPVTGDHGQTSKTTEPVPSAPSVEAVKPHDTESVPTLSIAEIVGVIDSYLLAIVLFIFALGMYELFISQIDEIEKGGEADDRPSWLAIHDLDDLKEKLAKVIIMILMVTFYEKVVQIEWVTPWEMILLAISILLISLTFFFLGKSKHEPAAPRHPKKTDETKEDSHGH